MRSLSQAGIGMLPWVQARDAINATIAITNATTRDGKNPQGQYQQEVVFTCRLLADMFDSYGSPIPSHFWMSLVANGPRMQYVDYFKTETEELGPVLISQLPGQNGLSGPFIFVDAAGMIDAETGGAVPEAGQNALPAASTRPADSVTARVGERPAARHIEGDTRPNARGGRGGASPSRTGSSASADSGDLQDLPF